MNTYWRYVISNSPYILSDITIQILIKFSIRSCYANLIVVVGFCISHLISTDNQMPAKRLYCFLKIQFLHETDAYQNTDPQP
jgi:hypothetical protein